MTSRLTPHQLNVLSKAGKEVNSVTDQLTEVQNSSVRPAQYGTEKETEQETWYGEV